ncbi:uncharacterized protein UV8b_04360 [Ustilaginoidea virens]|uniref:Uncharacterized protein n=1 Tax=Ustilaginoidea virens TaxID=1159556 RepID=A0A063C7A4_USTVR|nr:uncharacterized protein UV8b_04360 [Ustilaginoidea virens]QUC20119.1 hypothetical protein UV8b_04360 [Ustilaginoidea virens]GAO14557.1 hypothetical protein UVI_02032680 [Ustilaginoidea virens]
MDKQALASSFVPSTSTASSPSGPPEQRTYTTAGTIYKPSSTQPLQPPTRRGRSLKWSPAGLHADLALLPKSVLAGLPLRAPSGPPITALQQYTPLQQNYDRAISPFNEPDHILAKMPAEAILAPSTHTPGPLSSLSGVEWSGLDRPTAGDGERHSRNDSDTGDEAATEGEADDDFNMGALMNMTVKSLQNLASYPNPNQKTAQKALQRGTRPRPCMYSQPVTGLSSASPPSLATIGMASGASEGTSSFSYPKYACQTESSTFRPAQLDAIPKMDGAWSTRNSTPASAIPVSPRAKSTSSEVLKTHHSLAPTGPSPMPLTAGPPGQRQYRPSTFESTFKALKANSPSGFLSQEDDEGLLITTQTLMQAGIDDISLTPDRIEAIPKTSSWSAPPERVLGDSQVRRLESPSGMIDAADETWANTDRVESNSGRAEAWGLGDGRSWCSGSWRDQSPETRALYRPGTDRLTEAALATRVGKLENWWYSGVNRTYRNAESTALKQFGPGEPGFGVIGDKRPLAPIHRPGILDVEEAMAIPASEHARSLIEMAINALDESMVVRCSGAESAYTLATRSTAG